MVETSQQPEGLTQRMALHLLETFFRHPILHLLPLIIFVALGTFSAFTAEKMYRSAGVLNATSDTLLNELTGDTPTFGFESTATVTARNINQRLSTDAFLDDVIRDARLTGAVESGVISRDEIRRSISASPQGDNLISVSATTPRPEQSLALATATLNAFVEYVVSNDVRSATVEMETYEEIREGYREALDDAVEDVNAFLEQNPAGDEENRPIAQALELDRLRDEVERANELLQGAEANVNNAQLSQNYARDVVSSQLDIVDPPVLPTLAQAGLRQAALTIAIFTVLGAALSVGTVVLAAMLDRTIRVPNDVPARLGVDVLAVVPSARR